MLPRQPQAVLQRLQKPARCLSGPAMTISFKFPNYLFLSGDLSSQLSDVSLFHFQ